MDQRRAEVETDLEYPSVHLRALAVLVLRMQIPPHLMLLFFRKSLPEHSQSPEVFVLEGEAPTSLAFPQW